MTTTETPPTDDAYTPTDSHKKAMAIGRRQSKIIGDYLKALESFTPKRGRPVTAESVQAKIDDLDAKFDRLDPIGKLTATEQRLRLVAQLADIKAVEEVDLVALEEAFIEVAADYAERKDISYQAFRQRGVPAGVLKRAGIGS